MKLSNEEILVAFCLSNIPDIITQEEFDDVKKAIKELLKGNKELWHIVANKVIADYDIDTPLKKELGEARLKIVSLEDALSEYKKEKEDLIKWLEDKIKESEKVIDILNEPLYAEEIKKEVSINPIIPKIIAGNFLITLDKVRGINNDWWRVT